jgi:uncharacterized DUF497 family protein
VRIEFNPAKDAANLEKHGVSLALAHQLDWLAGTIQPARSVAGERRWKMLVALDGIVYAVIFTRRADIYRIISLRHASRQERRAL